MRRLRYAVAVSLDGYLAGPQGEADWIIQDPTIDFGALFQQFDTLFIGRRTFETMVNAGRSGIPGMRTIVFSRTLRPDAYADVTVLTDPLDKTVAELRAQPGKDIWLFGGGVLFRSLVNAGLVDTVEVAVIPILLGAGIPLFPPPAPRVPLTLTSHHVYPSGIVSLGYTIRKD